MKKNTNKGFTLIELLVVIAIIGILSAVVLASLSTARSRANDAKVQGQLSSMRGAAEIYYSGAGNYGAAGTSCTGSMFADATSGMAALSVSTAYPSGTTLVCNTSGSAWAASANLSTSGTYWCVDSDGSSKRVTTALGTNTVCPAS